VRFLFQLVLSDQSLLLEFLVCLLEVVFRLLVAAPLDELRIPSLKPTSASNPSSLAAFEGSA